MSRSDGLGTCYDCGGPVEPDRVRPNGKPMSKCRCCHAAYQRRRRAGNTEMLLTPRERDMILALRRIRQRAGSD